MRAARICSRLHLGVACPELVEGARCRQGAEARSLTDGLVTVFSPMGLNKDPVDLFQIDDAGLVADRLDEGGHAQVLGAAQQAFAGAPDQGKRFHREGVVAEAGAVEGTIRDVR